MVRRLRRDDLKPARQLNALFAEVFGDNESYAAAPPSDAYLTDLLTRNEVIALVAEIENQLAGGLVAYVLPKLEQERSEVYIYDLAVAHHRRRMGIATGLIEELQRIAGAIGAWVIYVQADYVDEPAVALYEKLGAREDVMHFDIAPRTTR
jgi:aminoglycoside 3-N-acetyltransferase I